MIPSNVDIVGITVKEIIQYLEAVCGYIDDDVLFDLRVILNELILNAIIHGNKADMNKYVKITTGLAKGNYIYMVVTDDGEGYDYEYLLKKCEILKKCEVPYDDYNINYLSETGRGILIIKSLCEKVKFNEKGNKVVVLKKLNGIGETADNCLK